MDSKSLKNSKRVVVALSGGVDSAVSAYLLKQEGYEVSGVHMHNWDSQINEISSDEDCQGKREDSLMAKKVSEFLDIPLYIYNFTKEYWDFVFKPYLKAFENNLIGNPDLNCNSKIKFGVLLDNIKREFGTDVKLATGHYARVTKENDEYFLETCNDPKKDQTYFLARLTQNQLKDILFPLSEFESKELVRKLAREIGLPNWDKKGSSGICFIGERKFNGFISSYIKGIGGKIIDVEKSQVLGHHKGLCYYSINQRRGVALKGQFERYYVCGKKAEESSLLVCRESVKDKYLIKEGCLVNDLHWINEMPKEGESVLIKFKHTSIFTSAKIVKINSEILELSHEPRPASTPGQYVVFYSTDKKRCWGSGIYCEPI